MEVMYPRCAGLDVHKETVVACVRIVEGGEVSRLVRTFATTTASLIELGEWLEANSCTQVGMEATGVYWKPVWQVLSDGSFTLVLANAAQVHEVGITFVVVTHDQEEALVMADRMAVLRDGRLLQCDTPHEIYEHPADRFVADFIGVMNFLRRAALTADGVDRRRTAR